MRKIFFEVFMSTLPFRAIVSDLDGTLLTPDHKISPFTVQTLRKLSEKGVDIILATGRNHTDVASILAKIDVPNAAMITSNGARVRDRQGNLLYANSLSPDLAAALYRVPFDAQKVCINTYQDEGWFINVDLPELTQFHQESGFTYQVVDFANHHTRDVEKVFFLGREAQDLTEVEQYLQQHFGEQTAIVYSALSCLEVMNQNVSKGDALAHLLQSRDYELADCIAFGDGMNDQTMLSRVGKGCIMQNADPRLKTACPTLSVIGENKDEAVAHYLHELFQL